jgi:outer membrane receptor protein involved in Fe transport
VGGYYVDIRNLGAQRTLVLMNGKRLGATTAGYQDLSQIPMSAVERIEILKDGASSIYGSDAIAGVVNVITRKNFDGGEASVYVGQYGKGDGDTETYSMTLGARGERGLTLSAEYSSRIRCGPRTAGTAVTARWVRTRPRPPGARSARTAAGATRPRSTAATPSRLSGRP